MGIQRIGILTLDPSSLEGHIGGKELSSHARRSAPPMSLDGRLPTFAVARIGAWRYPALNFRRRPRPCKNAQRPSAGKSARAKPQEGV